MLRKMLQADSINISTKIKMKKNFKRLIALIFGFDVSYN